jgi:hypothetical protein
VNAVRRQAMNAYATPAAAVTDVAITGTRPARTTSPQLLRLAATDVGAGGHTVASCH